ARGGCGCDGGRRICGICDGVGLSRRRGNSLVGSPSGIYRWRGGGPSLAGGRAVRRPPVVAGGTPQESHRRRWGGRQYADAARSAAKVFAQSPRTRAATGVFTGPAGRRGSGGRCAGRLVVTVVRPRRLRRRNAA